MHTGNQSSQDKSLLAWANVMSALAENQMQHTTKGDRQNKLFVPFRGSVLTRVLEESLGSDLFPVPFPSLSFSQFLSHFLSVSLSLPFSQSPSSCSPVSPHVVEIQNAVQTRIGNPNPITFASILITKRKSLASSLSPLPPSPALLHSGIRHAPTSSPISAPRTCRTKIL